MHETKEVKISLPIEIWNEIENTLGLNENSLDEYLSNVIFNMATATLLQVMFGKEARNEFLDRLLETEPIVLQ